MGRYRLGSTEDPALLGRFGYRSLAFALASASSVVLGAAPAWGADDDAPAAEAEPEFEGTAEVEAPPHEATKRTLEQEELTTTPGTRGDPLRAIEIMPGVSRTPFAANAGPPLLRGSPAGESQVMFDGAQAPLIYHFGGLTSVFNAQLLESVTLYPGNFSARYGRAAGGVVEVKVRDPKRDRLHAMLELSAIDSFALTEGPLGQDTSLALAARRSNIDLFFEAALDDDSTAVVAAPVYWDYQAILAHRFGSAHRLRVLAYGSEDTFELTLGKSAADDPALRGEFGARQGLHRLQVELESHFSERVKQELMLAVGPSPGRGNFGATHFDYTSWEAHARADWSVVASDWLRLSAGFDVHALAVTFLYDGPLPPPEEGAPSQGSLASNSPARIESELHAFRPAGYVEAALQPTASLLLVPGVRVDYFTDARAWSVDPRLSSRLALNGATTLKGGVGAYSQPGQYWEVMEGFGNPKVKPFRTLQASAGVEQKLGGVLTADLDGFYKRWEDRVLGTPGGAPPHYVNGGSGRAYGLELLLQAKLGERYSAFASYTLSRSTRRDGAGATERLFDRDQTHNLSVGASAKLGYGFRIGARFRYVTGSPYSAVRGAVYDATTDTYRPLYGVVNDARNPAFHQLDLRVEKLWHVGPVDLTAYLELMNAYNAQNQESRRYSFDYRESSSVVGLPFFPNLGLRGEL